MIADKDPLVKLIQRTMANLNHIKTVAAHEQASAAERSVFEVTQIVNSTMVVLLHPWEQRYGAFASTTLVDAQTNGWPHLESSEPSTDDPNPSDLKGAIRHLRNGLAHGHVRLHPNAKGEIASVEIEDRWPVTKTYDRQKPSIRKPGERIWGAKVDVTDMEKILKFISTLVSN